MYGGGLGIGLFFLAAASSIASCIRAVSMVWVRDCGGENEKALKHFVSAATNKALNEIAFSISACMKHQHMRF